MKKTVFACLCCALLASGLRAAEKSAGTWDARLRAYTGSVLVRPAGTKRWVQARPGLPLKQGDLVRTGKRSSADLSLDGKGIISMGAATEFALRNQRRTASDFVLSAGRVIAKVTGLVKLSARLTVRTPTAVCAVRGTEFGVAYDKDAEETLVNVFEEGSVDVTSLDEAGNPVGETITVIPRNEVRVKKEMEAMTLAPSPAQRYKDPGIFSVRKKLGELGKTYEPLQNREREELRGEIFGGGRHARASADGSGYDRQSAADGAPGKGGRKKGGDEYGEGADRAEERGADGRRKAQAGDGGARGAAARAGREERGQDAPDGVRKAGEDGDEGGDPRRMAGRHGRKKGRAGGDDGGPGDGFPGGRRGGKAGAPGTGSGPGDGLRPKSGSAGDDGPALLGRGQDGLISRPTSSTDKSVDAVVSRLQERLAYTGNEGAIPSSELRTLVISAARTSDSDATFLSALNVSLSERLAVTDAPSISTAKTAVVSPTSAVSTVKSPLTLTSPVITSPVITNTSITNTKITNTTIGDTAIKKK